MLTRIPFNRPFFGPKASAYLEQAIRQMHLSGDGSFTRRCHAWLESRLGIPRVLLTTSCTHALETAAILLDIRPGDEVIVPSFTFVSTVNAFVLRGATPVFADIRSDTLNLDERLLPQLITSRTRAIVPVHYGGVACAMDEIQATARAHALAVVEDNAHGLFGKYRGAWLGTLGDLSTQSFHETKNISCGEGGALLINDVNLIERAEIIREKGTNRSRFFRGEVDKYTWVDIGSSYLPSDALAALLLAQLDIHDIIQAHRRHLWSAYESGLADWGRENGVELPYVPPDCEHPAHLFYLLFPALESRQSFIAHMKSRGIDCVFHYVPLHLSPMGRCFGGHEGQCPVTESVSERLVRLPLFYGLSAEHQTRIIEDVRAFRTAQRTWTWAQSVQAA